MDLKNIEISPYDPHDETAVIQLWTDCGLIVPWNDPRRDIRRKLAVQAEWFLVAHSDERIIATVMAGYEGHRGWINYLAVHPGYQRLGVGRRMMDEVESLLLAAGCPKINLQVRSGNTAAIDFYERIGFKIDEAISLGKRLEKDDVG